MTTRTPASVTRLEAKHACALGPGLQRDGEVHDSRRPSPIKLGRLLATAVGGVLLIAGCGGGGGGDAPAKYSIGGTITGLTTSGLVLRNGNDSVSPAAGATSFVFATAWASGASYVVSVQTQPISEVCQVANGSGQVGSAAVTNVMVTCSPPVPGARNSSVSWIDSAGDLWLFGGYGFDSAGSVGSLNDLWRYSPGSGQWTWLGGSQIFNHVGVYGTQGMAAADNVPGSRDSSVSWIDSAGDLWLFGGYGGASGPTEGRLNDLWRYSPGSSQWTWLGGSNTVDAKGVYGTRGTAAAGNVPGARDGSVSWIDSAGDLWLFGGAGYDSAGTLDFLNDLWRYSPGSGQWTWLGGSNTVDAKGVYGTQGTAAAGNVPGARLGSVSWIDSAGDLWLFGGYGSDSTGYFDELNDLWRYSPGSGQWTWLGGSNTVDATGVYGTLGTAAVGNVPGARGGSVSWIDSAGDLWLFGGYGFGSSGTIAARLNDLWRYSPGSGQWTWLGGSNTVEATGVYGTQGTAAAGNVPGARNRHNSWIDSAGDLWLFGGAGYDSAGTLDLLNDLWRYSPGSGQWTWLSGSNTVDATGVYGP